MNNEKLSSRLAFILLSASTAIGLGNVWRFPYVTGKYGGAAFVLLYILCLLLIGIPMMVTEFAIGRAAQKSPGRCFEILEPKETKWHLFKYINIITSALLFFYYLVITGWVLKYMVKMCTGELTGITPQQVSISFDHLMLNWQNMWLYSFIVIFLSLATCYFGVQKGVERVTKPMMIFLFGFFIILVIKACSLPNIQNGLEYFLKPDFNRLYEAGIGNVLCAAMSQAFFSLSLGFGVLVTFGSYFNKERSLTGEALWISFLDTLIAILAGLIIFPACSSFGVNPAAGPELLFITLPNVFCTWDNGQLWGIIFFFCMFFAAFTSNIGIIEGIIAMCMDSFNKERKTVVLFWLIVLTLAVLPCIWGFNLWSDFHPLGDNTTIMDLEDFLLCSNFLPLAILISILFAVSDKCGWGWDNFVKEVNTGVGVKFPTWIKNYMRYVLPIIILIIVVSGYMSIFG